MCKRYILNITWKKLKRIPKIFIASWIFLGFFSVLSLVQLPKSPYQSLKNLKTYEITIDDVRLVDTYDKLGTRMRLEIISDNNRYYLYYIHYRDYKPYVESELLSGKVSSVTIKVAEQQAFRDVISNRIHVVDIRNDSTVFFDIETEKEILRTTYLSYWITFLIFCPLWLCSTIFLLHAYKLIVRI